MGLGIGFLRELIELKRGGALDGAQRVIEIGAQQLADEFLAAHEELDNLYATFGCDRIELGSPVGVDNFSRAAPSSRTFWKSLGMSYAAIDLVGDAISLDLNRDQALPAMRGAYDLVVNAGTTEHVANQDNAFRVIHDLARPGRGVMFHEVPSQGMLTHGLVNYGPKFFWHLCRENDYEVIKLDLRPSGTMPLPRDVIDSNARYGGHPLDDQMLPCFILRTTLRKPHDRSFCTPLDLG